MNIGIMQGRLTEPKGRGIQFFPFDNWENEFFLANKVGLNEIEFIFDYEDYENNPLWDREGINKIKSLINNTNVKINSVCFDYFMRRPFYKINDKGEREILKKENKEIFNKILNSLIEIGGDLIEIPSVDGSSIKTQMEKEYYSEFLEEVFEENSSLDFYIGLETDFKPLEFKNFLDNINNKKLKANYDSGNSSALGYDHYEEIITLNNYVYNVHIKDRILGGSTVELGTGSADFNKLFKGLKETKYSKSFILQAARGKDGREEENILSQIEFVKNYINKYLV